MVIFLPSLLDSPSPCTTVLRRTVAEGSCSPPVASPGPLALVLDMQTNGATISSENVYKNVSASGALAASPFRNLQFIKRFKVLKTKQIKLSLDI